MVRVAIEAVLLVAAYVAGVLTHKWVVKNAQKAISQAADAAKKV